MNAADVQEVLLRDMGLRVEPEMGRYVAERVAATGASEAPHPIPVMAIDARTGVPVRTAVPIKLLQRQGHSGTRAAAE
jgi:hypothetical protein